MCTIAYSKILLYLEIRRRRSQFVGGSFSDATNGICANGYNYCNTFQSPDFENVAIGWLNVRELDQNNILINPFFDPRHDLSQDLFCVRLKCGPSGVILDSPYLQPRVYPVGKCPTAGCPCTEGYTCYSHVCAECTPSDNVQADLTYGRSRERRVIYRLISSGHAPQRWLLDNVKQDNVFIRGSGREEIVQPFFPRSGVSVQNQTGHVVSIRLMREFLGEIRVNDQIQNDQPLTLGLLDRISFKYIEPPNVNQRSQVDLMNTWWEWEIVTTPPLPASNQEVVNNTGRNVRILLKGSDVTSVFVQGELLAFPCSTIVLLPRENISFTYGQTLPSWKWSFVV
jgi:hypothetical protein